LALTPGTRIGVYEITAQIGEGGMGQVYRATDTKLKREVAVKILPPLLADDADRLARFQREAEVLASLNHPNIAGIYGIEESHGVRALVLELVEGDDLSQRIARGAIPLDETLLIVKQIAEALEAAHERGIVHRDLKPANIKVRLDGTVKVLDFGLARAMESTPASATTVSRSPTITTPAMTHAGMILGTAAYMAPEQARGKVADRRADIWAFGCVLYEMLTGRRAFAGDEVSDVLASVLAREPDLVALPVNTPPSIRRLLRRCLEKDRNERLRDIGDARIEIRDALAGADPDASALRAPGAVRSSRERLAWLGALAALTLALGISLSWALRPTPTASEMRVDISTPPSTAPFSLAISPDGRTIAFVATAEGQSRLWLRSLESGSAAAVKGTDGAESPFWSPDSRSVGFFADGKLSRLDVDGGSVRILAAAPGGQGGTWSRDDVILFASLGIPISRVPATGGQPVTLSGLAQRGSDFSPQFLPDGRHFLYYVRGGPEARGVYVSDLEKRLDARRLLDSDTGAVYASSGHLVFIRQDTLFAQQFDPIRLELTGNPFTVAEHAGVSPTGPSVSSAGSIAYRTSSTGTKRQFVWFDRSGKALSQAGESVSTSLSSPSLSLDGQRVALYRGVNGNVDIWLLETKRGVFSRLTTDPADDVMPVWSPSGDRILFSSNRTGVPDLYQKSLAKGGSEELLLSTAEPKYATDWSADGRFVLFNSQHPTRSGDIWALPLDGNGKPFPIVQTSADEQRGQFSPDVRWFAFQSNESGRAEIYVQPFPGPEPGGQFRSTVAVRYVGDAMGRNCSTSRWMAGSWQRHSESCRTPKLPNWARRSRCSLPRLPVPCSKATTATNTWCLPMACSFWSRPSRKKPTRPLRSS
jgi:serine/threonine protein kinase/Tol biopolymer transport system component